MSKIKLGVVYGGISTEHEVSIKSAKSVIENLNKDKYEIFEIYIEKNGNWFNSKKEPLENISQFLKNLDVVFPVLHGIGGEDGSIQGFLEMLGVPYVGAGILSSANGMDKVYSKIIFEKAKMPQAKYVYIKNSGDNYTYVSDDFEEKTGTIKEISEIVTQKIKFPMFVKPSNSGSSVGIRKVHDLAELQEAIKYAAEFDKKILVEENIEGREIECAVLGNNEPKASCIGEIKAADDFYSYDAKYNNTESKTEIPKDIPKQLQEKVRALAIKAYKALDCKGLSRVDFFINTETEKIYINEINTMPGFTKISMYPKLWEYSGLPYSDLLDELIKLALENK